MSDTTTRTICDVTTTLGDGALRICSLIGDIEAEVHFEYERGEPGYRPSVQIQKVVTTKECTLYGDRCKLVIEQGADVREYLSITQITREEDDIADWIGHKAEDAHTDEMIDRFFADMEAA